MQHSSYIERKGVTSNYNPMEDGTSIGAAAAAADFITIRSSTSL